MVTMANSLWTLTLSEFRAQTASARATPGGGSVCAVSASLGLGLVIMALEITQKRAHDPSLDVILGEARRILDKLAESADDDVRAFDAYMLAVKLPQATEEQQHTRAEALQRAADVATQVPLAAANRAVCALELARGAAEAARSHVLSDVLAGAELLGAAVHGLLATLAMNLKSVDDTVRERTVVERDALSVRAQQALVQIRTKVRDHTGEHA
jgi:formiminotetrahydrofolate cyclodeaminase